MTAIARLLEPITPRPTPPDPVALQHLQSARQRSAVVWLVAGVLAAHHAGMAVLAVSAQGGGWVWSGLAVVVALAMLVTGFGQLGLLVRADRRRAGTAAVIGAVALLGTLLAPAAGFLVIVAGLLHLLAPLGAIALGIALLSLDPSMRAAARRPVAAVAAGTAVAATALAIGVVDTLVLLPLTMAPGMSLDELYAALAAAGEDGGTWMPIAWAGAWLVATVLLALGLLRNRRSARGALGVLLAVPVVALLGLPAVQFSIGMGISDTIVAQGGMSVGYPLLSLAAAVLAAVSAGTLIGARDR